MKWLSIILPAVLASKIDVLQPSVKGVVELNWGHSFSELGVEKAAQGDLDHWAPIRAPGEVVEDHIQNEKKCKAHRQVQSPLVPAAPTWNPDLSPAAMDRYKRMAQWSAASYCSQDSLLSWTCGPRCEGLTIDTHVVLYFKSSLTDTVGFIAVYTDLDSQEDQIIIAFRGSVTVINWVEDMRFVKEPSPWPDKQFPLARVHSGFLDSYADIATTIRSSVMVLIKRYPQSRIIITGHSLGGAVATHCAADMKFHLGMAATIELVTFHSPRVGNNEFAAFIDTIFNLQNVDPQKDDYMSRRFTNRDDPLAHLPPIWLDFLHVSQEVWVNLENETKACDPEVGEDPNCMNSVLMPVDIESHFYIWNVNFGDNCAI